jgi:ABC-type Na+ transport system ATPase subunit NatA
VRSYSGGQKRRLEIRWGIIHEPDILFWTNPLPARPQKSANCGRNPQAQENGMTIFSDDALSG